MLRTAVNRAIALALAAAGGTALALGAAVPASAHAALVGTDPEIGSTVETAPAEVSATFSEILDGPSTEIAVTDPTGEVMPVEAVVFDGDTFTQPMLYTTPGEYTVAFRVISEDGHRVDDELTFTVESIPEGLYAPGAEPTGDATADDATTDEAGPDETIPAETGGAATAAADEEDSNTGAALAAILLALLVIVVGGVVLVKTLGRKQHTDSGGQDGEGSA